MEIKDLHVAIVFSPICGPIPTGLLGLVLEAHLYEVQDDGDMAPKSRFTEHQKSTLVGHSDSTLDRVQKHHVWKWGFYHQFSCSFLPKDFQNKKKYINILQNGFAVKLGYSIENDYYLGKEEQ